MNVQLENLPNCLTKMRVEVPAEKVSAVREGIVAEYARHAKLPGYRPGKAPRSVVETKFRKEIREALEERILGDSCREAIAENKLRVLRVSEVEDNELTVDGGFRYAATLVLAPVFALPEYKGVAVEVPSAEVTDADLQAGLDRLREQFAEFRDVEGRVLALEDFAVITYAGTVDGKPLTEAVPGVHATLSAKEDFWIKLTPDAFLPGFSEALVGAAVGETRDFDIALPADFALKLLAGITVHYTVTLKAIKEKILPEVDDAFAEKIAPGKKLEELRELMRGDLGNQKSFEREQAKRVNLMHQLMGAVEFELPEEMVRAETQRLLGDMVRENQNRGVSDDILRENAPTLISSAGETARERLKGTFLLVKIAEEEKITVSREELNQRISMMAVRYEMTADKLWKKLEKSNMLDRLHEEILTGKTLDFLVANATVSDKAAAAS